MSFKKTTAAFTALLFVLSFSHPAMAQSLLQKAEIAFQSAQKLETDLKAKSAGERSRTEYLSVISAFQRVYVITPHTGYADNALIAIAELYEAIKDTPASVRTLNFLVREYPSTPFVQAARDMITRLEGTGGTAEASQRAAVNNIRYWEAPNSVRVVVDVTGNPTITQGEAKKSGTCIH
jgi:hypothetical protein